MLYRLTSARWLTIGQQVIRTSCSVNGLAHKATHDATVTGSGQYHMLRQRRCFGQFSSSHNILQIPGKFIISYDPHHALAEAISLLYRDERRSCQWAFQAVVSAVRLYVDELEQTVGTQTGLRSVDWDPETIDLFALVLTKHFVTSFDEFVGFYQIWSRIESLFAVTSLDDCWLDSDCVEHGIDEATELIDVLLSMPKTKEVHAELTDILVNGKEIPYGAIDLLHTYPLGDQPKKQPTSAPEPSKVSINEDQVLADNLKEKETPVNNSPFDTSIPFLTSSSTNSVQKREMSSSAVLGRRQVPTRSSSSLTRDFPSCSNILPKDAINLAHESCDKLETCQWTHKAIVLAVQQFVDELDFVYPVPATLKQLRWTDDEIETFVVVLMDDNVKNIEDFVTFFASWDSIQENKEWAEEGHLYSLDEETVEYGMHEAEIFIKFLSAIPKTEKIVKMLTSSLVDKTDKFTIHNFKTKVEWFPYPPRNHVLSDNLKEKETPVNNSPYATSIPFVASSSSSSVQKREMSSSAVLGRRQASWRNSTRHPLELAQSYLLCDPRRSCELAYQAAQLAIKLYITQLESKFPPVSSSLENVVWDDDKMVQFVKVLVKPYDNDGYDDLYGRILSVCLYNPDSRPDEFWVYREVVEDAIYNAKQFVRRLSTMPKTREVADELAASLSTKIP